MNTALASSDNPQREPVTKARCIACGQHQVEQFLDIGDTALANRFLTEDELVRPEASYPLRVGFCHTCSHVQLVDIVPPTEMFTDYLYMSSASDTLVTHLTGLSDEVVKRYNLGPNHLSIDIGCNDGTLLQGLRRHGLKVLGVDPAENLAELVRDAGIERYVGFFSFESSETIVQRWGEASAIFATNTFPHIPNLPDFLEGINRVLAPDGVVVLEMHYLLDLVEQSAFDTIYHEHVSYWALRPMKALLERHGLEMTDVQRLPIHHGQIRVFIRHAGTESISPNVNRLLKNETDYGLGNFETFQSLALRASDIKSDLASTLAELKASGKTVVGYGAPAKGNTLLEFLGLDRTNVSYIVDRSPLKQGRFTPGSHIPVVSPTRLLDDQPDYVLLLAWNFADEIMEQQAEFRLRGGQFILPVPKPLIISND